MTLKHFSSAIPALFIIVVCLTRQNACQSTICKNDREVVCNEDCSQIIECVGDGDGFLEIPLEQCNTDKYCYKTEPDLTCQYHSACQDPQLIEFQCTGQAVFPDPFDCTKFYMCVKNEDGTQFNPSHLQCEAGIAYDYRHKYCNMPVDATPHCPGGPVPFCLTLGQNGPLEQDDNIYYVCHRQDTTLFPVLYQCPAGGSYNPTSLGCDK